MKSFPALLILITLGASVKLPSNFQKCSRKDPKLKECLLKASQNGISQLTKPFHDVGLPNLNPFEVAEMTVGGGTGPVAVEQKFKNCKLYGLQNIKFEKFNLNFDEKKLDIAGVIPEIRKLCSYEMKGQVLVIPINGKGKSTIVLKNLKFTDVFEFTETKKKDKTYLKCTSSKINIDPELVTFDFQNSVDKRITDRLNPILNENWKDLFNDVKDGYAEIINQIFLSVINNFFSKVSEEEALDE